MRNDVRPSFAVFADLYLWLSSICSDQLNAEDFNLEKAGATLLFIFLWFITRQMLGDHGALLSKGRSQLTLNNKACRWPVQPIYVGLGCRLYNHPCKVQWMARIHGLKVGPAWRIVIIVILTVFVVVIIINSKHSLHVVKVIVKVAFLIVRAIVIVVVIFLSEIGGGRRC
uniref:Uncharacterized protein n=1 Tax=Arundo donax TaxID=35708 RepID=A0A0A8YE08_ARUDO